jgi:regulator of cell morphogenesis and NO signaling
MITNKFVQELDVTHLQELAAERLRFAKDGIMIAKEERELIALVSELFLDPESFSPELFSSYSIPSLLNYLRNGHKMYEFKRLPELQLSVILLTEEMGVEHPLSIVLTAFMERYRKDLCDHMRLEDNFVFPYIAQLNRISAQGGVLRPATFLNGWSTLAAFLEAHTDTEIEIQLIRSLLEKFQQQTPTMQVNRLLNQLAILEIDLHIHARIEDEVLMPKALQLEKLI